MHTSVCVSDEGKVYTTVPKLSTEVSLINILLQSGRGVSARNISKGQKRQIQAKKNPKALILNTL